MDFVKEVKDLCDSIESKTKELSKVLSKDESGKMKKELDNIVEVVLKIKNTVNEYNVTDVKDELLVIKNKIDELFEKAI